MIYSLSVNRLIFFKQIGFKKRTLSTVILHSSSTLILYWQHCLWLLWLIIAQVNCCITHPKLCMCVHLRLHVHVFNLFLFVCFLVGGFFFEQLFVILHFVQYIDEILKDGCELWSRGQKRSKDSDDGGAELEVCKVQLITLKGSRLFVLMKHETVWSMLDRQQRREWRSAVKTKGATNSWGDAHEKNAAHQRFHHCRQHLKSL